jgi:hypothetical protein
MVIPDIEIDNLVRVVHILDFYSVRITFAFNEFAVFFHGFTSIDEMDVEGFGPPLPSLSDWCINRTMLHVLTLPAGFEPAKSGFEARHLNPD